MNATQANCVPTEVLLVDDDSVDVRLTTRLLQEQLESITINSVPNGVEALNYLRREDRFALSKRPDLIVLDLNMPRMDGRELLSVIKSDEDLQDIPVVVLSTSDAQDDVQRCYKLHANSYLKKSSNLDEARRSLSACTEFWLKAAVLPDVTAEPRVYGESLPMDSFPIMACHTCDVPIPPIRVGIGPRSRRWQCRKCGSQLVGALRAQDWKLSRENLRPVHYFGNERPSEDPDQHIRNFVRTLYQGDLQSERRDAARRPLVIRMPTLRLDADFYPLGDVFTTISRNISTTGMSLIHTEKVTGHLATLIDIPGHGTAQFVLEIVRCVPMDPYYEIAGRIIKRL